jgi:hypothetical protein
MTAVNTRLSSQVIDIVRRMRGRGSKLTVIASSVGHSASGVHRYVRDIACPINHSAMALRRQVTLSRKLCQEPARIKSNSQKHSSVSLRVPDKNTKEFPSGAKVFPKKQVALSGASSV